MSPLLSRREWIAAIGAVSATAAVRGSTLVHEHVLVDFIGGDVAYDPDEVFRVALPRLRAARAQGCTRLLECTPNYLGRDPRLLLRLSRASGIDIWTNTGLYGAVDHKYLPEYARTESAQQLANRWIDEFRAGVAGIQPRFVKIGVNRGPLGDLDRKLAQAAAIASRATGLTVASHTGNGIAALEQIEIFRSAGTPPGRFVWVHAQNEKDHGFHRSAAQAGAWVEFDGIAEATAQWHLDCLKFMKSERFLNRTLVSQDSGWYHVGERNGGDYRGYSFIYTDFLPRLDTRTATSLMIDNPAAAFGRR